MKNRVVAVVGLAPGRVGFYDPYTKIHMNLEHPTAEVWNYMRTTYLRRAVKEKQIILISGVLRDGNTPANLLVHDETPVFMESKVDKEESQISEPVAAEPEQKAAPKIEQEAPKVEEEKTESVEENTAEEDVKSTTKKTRRKKATTEE